MAKQVTYTSEELSGKTKAELIEIATATPGVEVKSHMTNAELVTAIEAAQTGSPAAAGAEDSTKKLVAEPVEDPKRFDGRLNQPTERPEEVAVADIGGDPAIDTAKQEPVKDSETGFDKHGRASLGR